MLKPAITTCLLLVLSANTYAAAVATSSSYATDVAKQILKSGGNAVDAACAASFALNVTQSYFTGVGGGGFATLQTKTGNSAVERHFLDFRPQASGATTPNHYATGAGKFEQSWTKANTGPWAVAVPGFVAGCGVLHRKYGKLSWKQIVEPAVKLATEGYTVTQMYQEEEADQWKRISQCETTKTLFGGEKGDGLKNGETHKQPLLAKTLTQISEQGADSFYRGALSQAVLKDLKSLKVKITKADLTGYKVRETTPVAFSFGTYRGYTADLPSAAGIMVGSSLRYIASYYAKHGTPKPDSAVRYIVTAEVLGYFAELRSRALADKFGSRINTKTYMGSTAEAQAFRAIDARIAARLKSQPATKASDAKKVESNVQKPEHEIRQSHTANVSVVDDNGMAIALTSSVGAVYGSCLTTPQTGFVLNSDMGDFETKPGLPNSPAAGRRPRSNMSPTLVYEMSGTEQKLVGVVGAAGGPIIPTAMVQFIENYFIHKMTAEDALSFARVHPDDEGGLEVEKHINADTFADLKKAGYEVSASDTIWAILEATVRKTGADNWNAVSDARYDGKSFED